MVFDVAAFPDAGGHLVDLEGVRAGAVDHDGGVDLGAVGQGDALDLALGGADFDHLGVEHEGGALGFGGAHDVVGRQGRVVDIAALGAEQAAFEHLGGFFPEGRILGAFDRPELVQVEHGDHLQDLFVGQFLILDAHGIVVFFDVLPLVPLGFDQQGAGVHELGQALLVFDVIQVVFPIQPVLEPFVGEGHTVFGGVVGADDGAGTGRRAFTGIGQFVHAHGLVAHLGKLVGNGGTDHPGPDDNGVILFGHGFLRQVVCVNVGSR